MTTPPDAEFDWAERYRTQDTPWDKGAPHPELAARLAAGHPSVAPPPGGRALVPGCGRGYDALALADAGWGAVGVDLASEVADEVGAAFAARGAELRVADALALEDADGFQLAFDHTFFCAIRPAQRAAWGAMLARLVRPGGHVCSIVFPIGRPSCAGGPPFGVEVATQARALGDAFELVEDVACAHDFAAREWDERWATFRRLG